MFHPMMSGGDKGTRTPGLCIANASLYQLSHIPKISKSILADFPEKSYHFKGPFKKNFRSRSDSSSKDFLPHFKRRPVSPFAGRLAESNSSPSSFSREPLSLLCRPAGRGRSSPHHLGGDRSPSSVAFPEPYLKNRLQLFQFVFCCNNIRC